VVITAVLWALLHTQYEPAIMLWIFLCGLYLGYARLRTRSLYIVILMHGVMNTLATAFLLVELLFIR
jgi:membrane protease YdiL (CAAX protease family)